MKHKRQEDGFSVTLVFVVVVAVLAIGFGVLRMVASNNDNTANNSDNTQQTSNNEQQENAPLEEGDNFLVITEWGLRVTLPPRFVGDMSYAMNENAYKNHGGPIVVDFMSKEFSEGSLKCAEVEGNNPRVVVSIFREKNEDGVFQQEPQPFKRIGDTRYYFTGPTACEEAIIRSGSTQDKQLLMEMKSIIINTLEEHDN